MNKQRTSESIDWFMRLSESDVSETELSDWAQWCTDRENLQEFQKVHATWRGFGQLGPAASPLLEQALQDATLDQKKVSPSMAQSAQRRAWTRWQASLAAAMAIIAIGVAAWLALPAFSERREIVARESIKTRSLPDGSVLTLAPRTSVEIDFRGTDRALAFERGEAYFKVHPDRTKPFVVQTAGVRVTAVGTAFDVRSEEQRVTVTVHEGVVDVAAAEQASMRLRAGQRAVINPRGAVSITEQIDIARVGGWRDGRLEYFGAPLSEVVTDISRYSNTMIEIGDPQLARLTYTGSVFTHAVDNWLTAIEATFPVRVLTTRDEHVVLLRRSIDAPVAQGSDRQADD